MKLVQLQLSILHRQLATKAGSDKRIAFRHKPEGYNLFTGWIYYLHFWHDTAIGYTTASAVHFYDGQSDST